MRNFSSLFMELNISTGRPTTWTVKCVQYIHLLNYLSNLTLPSKRIVALAQLTHTPLILPVLIISPVSVSFDNLTLNCTT
jgi:hypothetical protein